MKLSLAVLIFMGVVSVFCNAATVDDDAHANHELLSSEGEYQDGSAFVWTKILNRVEKYATLQGQEILQQIAATLVNFNKAFLADDYPSMSTLYAKIGNLYIEVVPNIQNNKALAEAILFTGNRCEELAEKFKSNNATIKDVAELSQIAAKKIISTFE